MEPKSQPMVLRKETKRALLVGFSDHNYSGGVEKYMRGLIRVLQSLGYEVSEYSTCNNWPPKVCERIAGVKAIEVARKSLSEKNIADGTAYTFWGMLRSAASEIKALRYQKKHLRTVAENFDLVIDNQFFGPLSDANHPRIIWIQHFDFGHMKRSFETLIRVLLCFFLGIRRSHKVCYNKVVYSPYSEAQFRKLYPKIAPKCAFHSIFLSLDWEWADPATATNEEHLAAKFVGPIVFLGRAEDPQKNIAFANKVAKHLNRPVHVYGKFDPAKTPRKYPHLVFKRAYSSSAGDMRRILSESSLTLVTSRYEGVGYVALESLASATPVAVRFTFAEAQNLVKHGNGLLFPKRAGPKRIAGQINALLSDRDRYSQMVKNTFAWKGELDHATFVARWTEVIKQAENR